MSGFELVLGVLAIFFVAVIVGGVLLVCLLPRSRDSGQRYPDGPGWQEPPTPSQDGQAPPWWHSP